MLNGFELVLRRRADALGRRVRRFESRVLSFQRLEAAKEIIVFGVADFGTCLVVIEVCVTPQLRAEGFGLLEGRVRYVVIRVGHGCSSRWVPNDRQYRSFGAPGAPKESRGMSLGAACTVAGFPGLTDLVGSLRRPGWSGWRAYEGHLEVS